jgi:hypothetical protein
MIWAAAHVLRGWIERYGAPRALYTDWKNVYVQPPSPQERVGPEAAKTQFGRMCEELGVRIVAASSPQAKGRVERGAWHAPGPAGEEARDLGPNEAWAMAEAVERDNVCAQPEALSWLGVAKQ